MQLNQKKLFIAVIPFIFFIGSIITINALSIIESDPLDAEWKTRQLIIGLFVFAAISFLPGLLHLKIGLLRPYVRFNLSHHPPEIRKSHELFIRSSSICTGCLGSVLSIIFSSIILIIYFFFPAVFHPAQIPSLFFVGTLLILVTFSRYFTNFSPLFRLIQHTTLFQGIALFIIINDLVFHSAFLMVLFLPSWFIFLLARVQLSRIDHSTEINYLS
jgi:hypothetical protein